MKKNFYIFTSGILKRKDNTIYFEPFINQETQKTSSLQDSELSHIPEEEYLIDFDEEEDKQEKTAQPQIGRKFIPVESIDSIYCFGEHRFNTKFLNFLSQNQIPLHIFNYFGFYSGTFYPRETQVSGKLLIAQVQHYLNETNRLYIAKEFIRGSIHNMIKNLQYYNNRDKDLSYFIDYLTQSFKKVEEVKSIEELMGIEGTTRKNYYESWHLIINQPIDFEKREKQPPPNPINALISFGNSLLYTTVLSEIYRNQLNPTISYLHSPGERRFSLSLDIAEIFKPLIVDRLIFALLNKNIIKDEDFDQNLNSCLLNEKGRKTFIKEYDEKLATTIKHRKLNRSISYQTLIRYECYKLIKHLLDAEKYQSFKIWW
ncbi:MAG: type I-B CRISPR-associated endonuclease Cas1b [Ignavibacteria bacterium]